MIIMNGRANESEAEHSISDLIGREGETFGARFRFFRDPITSARRALLLEFGSCAFMDQNCLMITRRFAFDAPKRCADGRLRRSLS